MVQPPSSAARDFSILTNIKLKQNVYNAVQVHRGADTC